MNADVSFILFLVMTIYSLFLIFRIRYYQKIIGYYQNLNSINNEIIKRLEKEKVIKNE